MKIALISGSVSRAAGGVLPSLCGLASSLVLLPDVELEVLGIRDGFTDRDMPGWKALRIKVFESRMPKRASYAPELRRYLFTQAELDVAHIHSIWLYPSRAILQWARQTLRPYLITTHGMLEPWALRNSRWKKVFAGILYANDTLHSATCVHALCESEYRSIRAYGLRNPVCIIPNGVDLPQGAATLAPPWAGTVEVGRKVMLFLGRIHRKKGLANLVEAWWRMRQSCGGAASEWSLVIAGWGQGGHEEELKKMVAEKGLSRDVVFLGPVFGEVKRACLQNADAFILPSHSEGLPMSILEAWSYGLPVMMTRECNIPEGYSRGAAIEIRPEVESIQEGFEHLISLTATERASMGGRGRELVRTQFAWPDIASQMVRVYRWCLEQGPQPDCVRLD